MFSFDPAWDPSSAPTFWINQASRLLMRDFEAGLRPLGFGMAYIPVMALLAERGPLQQKDLVAAIGIEQPTMAALLARMERDGVVVRLPHPGDRRSKRFELTISARTRLPDAGRILGDVVDRALAGIGDTDRQAMLRTLRQVAVNLDGTREDRRPPPPPGS